MAGTPEPQRSQWDLDDPAGFSLALWHAIKQPDYDLLATILDRDESLLTGFDHDGFTNPGSDTILHEAVRSGNAELVKFLIERGANVNIYNKAIGGDTVLDVAIARHDHEMITLLVKQGANPNAPTWMWATAANNAATRLGEPECNDEEERAAMHAVLEAAGWFPPPIYPDGTVPESWPPTPEKAFPKRVHQD